ncbi:MAG: hypothetical protein MUD01_04990 [Chloroflexaceae bacterium]|nr:hypothetical protein [Chloroflexaceae bacterium]
MSQTPSTNTSTGKTFVQVLVDWSKPIAAVFSLCVVIATIATFLFGDGVLLRGADVRYIVGEPIPINPENFINAITIFNRGERDAEDVTVRFVFSSSEITSYNCSDQNFIDKPQCEKSEDNKSLIVRFSRLSPEFQDETGLGHGMVVLNTRGVGERPSTRCMSESSCREGVYLRSLGDTILLGLLAFFVVVFLLRDGVPFIQRVLAKKIRTVP